MNGLGTLTGAPQAGMPQVQNPTLGMGGIAQPPAPGGATNRPVVEMRAQILRNIFGNIGAPMPDDIALQIASQPSPFERQLEGMRQKAVVQGQIDMAKKLMELEVAIEQERRTKQVGREDIIARTTRPRREGLVPGILRGTGLSQYLPESLTTKPSIEELETQQGESRALRELRQAQTEKARRPETSTTDPLISAKRELDLELANLQDALTAVDAEPKARGLMGIGNEGERKSWEARRKRIVAAIRQYRRNFWAEKGYTVAEMPPPSDEDIAAAVAAVQARKKGQPTRDEVKRELSDMGFTE